MRLRLLSIASLAFTPLAVYASPSISSSGDETGDVSPSQAFGSANPFTMVLTGLGLQSTPAATFTLQVILPDDADKGLANKPETVEKCDREGFVPLSTNGVNQTNQSAVDQHLEHAENAKPGAAAVPGCGGNGMIP